MFTIPDRRPLVFGHRGARRQAPENTLPAFQRALEIGADGIELDVQLSADKQLVVFHDEELSRTSNGAGRVQDFPLADLKDLDVGYHFSPSFAETRICTLDEVFEAVGKKLLVNVEIKPFAPIGQAVRLTVNSIRYHGMQTRVIISSFNPLILRRVRQLARELSIGFLYDEATTWLVRNPLAARALIGPYQASHPRHTLVDAQMVERAHKRGYRINVWTLNEREDINQMIDAGVDMIISDVPDFVHSVIQNRKKLDL